MTDKQQNLQILINNFTISNYMYLNSQTPLTWMDWIPQSSGTSYSAYPHYWEDDINESTRFLELQTGEDLPEKIKIELKAQKKRIDEELFH